MMNDKEAIGIIEIQNYTNALIACDLVSKNGALSLIHHQEKLGGRLVTLVFQGSVSALNAAFYIVKLNFKDSRFIKVCEVVSNPTKEIMNYMYRGDFEDDSEKVN